MKWRLIVLTALFAVTVGTFFDFQKRGWIALGEEWFLDFLVANSRDAMEENLPQDSQDVVIVEFQEALKDEFAAWPPSPLDWIMVLKRILNHSPEVVVIAEPLRWENMDPQIISQMQKSLLQFQTVVFGFNLGVGDQGASKEPDDFASNEMPVLTRVEKQELAIGFNRVTQVADRTLRLTGQAGFSEIEGGEKVEGRVLFAAGDGQRIVPSLAAQSVTLFEKKPYSALRLRFGTGACLSLGEDMVVPLNRDGSMSLRNKPAVPSIDALELMVPDVGDEIAQGITRALGKDKLIVLTLVDANGNSVGKDQALAMAQALAMPALKKADDNVDWLLAGLAAVLCYVFQLRFERGRAVMFGAGMMVLGMASSLVVFHTYLLWWAPLLASAIILVGTLFCFLWPYRSKPAVVIADNPPNP